MTHDTARPSTQPTAPRAFASAIPIAMLGGLIGLGGAEFRLPVLAGPFGYPAKRAVPLNLAISMATILASLAIRGARLSWSSLTPFWGAMLSVVVGAMISAVLGTSFASRIDNHQLERVILGLLLAIGTALIVEGLLPEALPGLLPTPGIGQVVAGVTLGLAIGFVSSVLGVAGGELIIPTMVFVFGADIKTAGTASLVISAPPVLVGILRYRRRQAYADRQALRTTVLPMSLGSVVGAVLGGLLVGLLPVGVLKIGLGVILIVSAVRIFRHRQPVAAGGQDGPQ